MKLIKTIPMDAEWKERLKDKWWATNYEGDKSTLTEHQKKLLELRNRLIAFGGEEVAFPFPNEYIDRIMDKGIIKVRQHNEDDINSEDDILVVYVEGEPCRCHDNSAILWAQMKDEWKEKGNLKIMTGYALSENGMWREHSWCLLEDAKDFNGMDIYIETTEKRAAYYGFAMDENEAYEFSKEAIMLIKSVLG